MSGRAFWSWRGRPAISQDGQVRYVDHAGGAWTGATDATAVELITLAADAFSIGRDEFYARFAGAPWSLPDLDGWYQSPATLAAQPFDWARARLYAR
jgi:hypothetical protein